MTRISGTSCSGNHTACPSGYVAWHCWADRKARTHRQEQCPVCGLWAIWIPDHVGTRPIRDDVATHKVTDTPSPMTGHTNPVDPRQKTDTVAACPDTFPEEWCNE